MTGAAADGLTSSSRDSGLTSGDTFIATRYDAAQYLNRFFPPSEGYLRYNATAGYFQWDASITVTNITVATTITVTSLTEGSVIFAGSGGVLSEDNNNFFYNDSDNVLLLGTNITTSATNILEIAGNTLVTSTKRIQFYDDQNYIQAGYDEAYYLLLVGDTRIELNSANITIGDGSANTIASSWSGSGGTGYFNWASTLDYFQLGDDLLMGGAERTYYRDTDISIWSSTDGQMDIAADAEVQIATVLLDINANVDISGDLYLHGSLQMTVDAYIGTDEETDMIQLGESQIIMAYDLLLTNGYLYLGDSDTTRGDLYIHGAGTGEDDGGTIRIRTSADYDAVVDEYIIKAYQDTLTIGPNIDTDAIVIGADSSVILNADALIAGAYKWQFGDSGTYIHQSADGVLDVVADGSINIQGSTEIYVSDNDTFGFMVREGNHYYLNVSTSDAVPGIYFGDASINPVYEFRGSGTVTFSGNTIHNSTTQAQFGDAGTYIHQSADGVLAVVSDNEVDISCTTLDINANVDITGYNLSSDNLIINDGTARTVIDFANCDTAGDWTGINFVGAAGFDSNRDYWIICDSYNYWQPTGLFFAGDASVYLQINPSLTPNFLFTGISSFTGEVRIADDIVLTAAKTIGADNTGGLTFDASNNAFFSAELTVGGNIDLNGNDLILSAGGNSYLHESSSDVIDLVLAGASGEFAININGAEDFKFVANDFQALAGSSITIADLTQNRVLLAGAAGVIGDSANLTFDGSAFHCDGSAVFNESGAAVDFRVEGDNKTHLLFVDGSADRVGINTSAPFKLLHIHGTSYDPTIYYTSPNVDHGMYPATQQTNCFGVGGIYWDVYGGYRFSGFSDDAQCLALYFAGIVGDTTVTDAATRFTAIKKSGIGGTALAAAERCFRFDNAGTNITSVYGDGHWVFPDNIEPDVAGTNDIGATDAEWQDLYQGDGAVHYFGLDQDVSLTHVADAGLLLNSTRYLAFNNVNSIIYDDGTDFYMIGDADVRIQAEIDIDLEPSVGVVNLKANTYITGTVRTTSADDWDLEDYHAGTPAADTGSVKVTINGTDYYLRGSTNAPT